VLFFFFFLYPHAEAERQSTEKKKKKKVTAGHKITIRTEYRTTVIVTLGR